MRITPNKAAFVRFFHFHRLQRRRRYAERLSGLPQFRFGRLRDALTVCVRASHNEDLALESKD